VAISDGAASGVPVACAVRDEDGAVIRQWVLAVGGIENAGAVNVDLFARNRVIECRRVGVTGFGIPTRAAALKVDQQFWWICRVCEEGIRCPSCAQGIAAGRNERPSPLTGRGNTTGEQDKEKEQITWS